MRWRSDGRHQPAHDLQRQTHRIIIGLGNPILGDDGFGWVVAEQVRRSIDEKASPVDIECFSLGGLSLMERLVGYDDAILIDAIHLGNSPIGTLHAIPWQKSRTIWPVTFHPVMTPR